MVRRTDELAEAGLRIKRLEEELAALQDARVIASDRTKAAQAAVAIALSTAAERIEGITKKLNQSVGAGNGDSVPLTRIAARAGEVLPLDVADVDLPRDDLGFDETFTDVR